MNQPVQVTILGQRYTVRSEAPAEEVQRVADFVNGRIAEVAAGGKVVDTLDIVVLTLLNVAGAYLKLCDEVPEPKLQQRLEDLLRRLEAMPSAEGLG